MKTVHIIGPLEALMESSCIWVLVRLTSGLSGSGKRVLRDGEAPLENSASPLF